MNEAHLDKRYSSFVIGLLILFPILINSVKILGNIILLILVILGLYIAISEKKNPFKIQELKVFSWITVGYFFTMLLSILIADGFNAEFHHLGRKAHFLLAPLIALSIYQIDLPFKNILLAVKMGLIIIGIVVMVQFLLGSSRPSGMINANIFGDIAVAMLFLSIVQVFNEKPKEQIITFIAAVAGVVAIFLSGSRGSWLSFIILSITFILLVYKPFLMGNKKNQLFLVLFFSVLFGFIGTQTDAGKKITNAVINIQNWDNGDQTYTSSGIRMEMWESSLEAAKNSLWFGYGYRNSNKEVSKYVDSHNHAVAAFTHLHNEYLTTLLAGGLLGLVSLLVMLFIPIVFFYKNLKNQKTYYYASAGILLSIGYATFGFTHIAFGEEHVNAFYIFMLAFLLPRSMGSNEVS
ncbi:O-antigen ligase family protein [Candidatus Thioglobus sp.]|nr:O-antigen ligase family protein [Candidatus Thioglobus sp.]